MYSKFENNTEIYNYPNLLNENFTNTKNTFDKFYISKDDLKTRNLFYTSTDSLNAIRKRKYDVGLLVAPVNNSSVTSELGKFNILQAKNITVNELNVDKIPGVVKYRNLNTNHFGVDDEGTVSISKNLIPENLDQAFLIWGSPYYNNTESSSLSTNRNLLVGKIAENDNEGFILKDKEKSHVTENIIIGDKSLLNIKTGNNNIVIGNDTLQTSINLNNNVFISNDAMSNAAYNKVNNNIVIGTALKKYFSNTTDIENVFSIGNDEIIGYISGNMDTGELILERPNASLKIGNDIFISTNKSSDMYPTSETPNIIIGNSEDNSIIRSLNGNIVLGNDNKILNNDNIGFENSIIIGNNNTNVVSILDGLDINSNSLIIGNNNKPFIEGGDSMSVDKPEKYLALHGDIYMPELHFSASGTVVGIASDGNLVKLVSSKKYKKNINSINKYDSSILYDVRPVTYEDINDNTGKKHYGFIAEEIEKLDDKLVNYALDENNELSLQSVSYERFVVLLVNEIKNLKGEIEVLSKKLK